VWAVMLARTFILVLAGSSSAICNILNVFVAATRQNVCGLSPT
jgi:hypothetical protein